MAAVFTLLFVLVLVGFAALLRSYRATRIGNPRVGFGCLPVLALVGLLLAYLVAKVIYEEIVPCVAVDRRYCDFASTQYRNLFGWEF
jgi:hypothetical protein